MQKKEKEAFLKKFESEMRKLLSTASGRQRLKKSGFNVPKLSQIFVCFGRNTNYEAKNMFKSVFFGLNKK